MAAIDTTLGLRRLAFYALILLALTLVSMVTFVVLTEEDMIGSDADFPIWDDIDPDKRPRFDFPESVRTFDTTLNRFVDRFARVCVQGDYAGFRLMYTDRDRPAPPDTFFNMFHAVKEVHIRAIEPIPASPGIDGPAHILLAEYTLEPYADPDKTGPRSIRLAITREDGQWRIGPIPGPLLRRLDAAMRTTTAPAATSDRVPPVSSDVDAGGGRRPTTNQPASIDS